jgi:hypothetical protein
MGTSLTHKLRVANRIATKKFYSLIGGMNTRLQPSVRYNIKAGYHHAKSAESFDDTAGTDEFQREVYELAAQVASDNNYSRVIDVGCGSAHKLIKYLGHLHTIGIEVQPTHQWLTNRYPERSWVEYGDSTAKRLEADLVVCSDVIEHIAEPDSLMDYLAGLHAKQFVISTPERDLHEGVGDYGPPENTSHYREWNAPEFYSYISSWFDVLRHETFHAKSITQVIIAKPRQ